MIKELEYWIILSVVQGIGIHKKLELLTIFGDAQKVFEAEKDALLRAGLTAENYEQLNSDIVKEEAKRILDLCQKKNIKIVTMMDSEYPEMLKYIYDPPIVLYVKGDIPQSNAVAVVGSRRASGYGIETAFKLSSGLAQAGVLVVSGLARGIDTAAHCGALNESFTTVAVLGCGVDIPYPPENKSLMERIIQWGAVISEYPPGTPPAPYNFPSRNRIISGMSLGTLVVEAGLKSGSLITAKYALEQGRDVFAVPGNINHLNSMGTNRLIKDGAKIVLGVDDILEELNFGLAPVEKVKVKKGKASDNDLNDEGRKIINALKIEDLYDEELSMKTAIPLNELFEILLDLELKGMIRKSITGKHILLG